MLVTTIFTGVTLFWIAIKRDRLKNGDTMRDSKKSLLSTGGIEHILEESKEYLDTQSQDTQSQFSQNAQSSQEIYDPRRTQR